MFIFIGFTKLNRNLISRSAIFVVISIVRMKYLVRRWHSGVRIAEKINSRHYRHLSAKQPDTTFPTQFQVGQPVSSQFFSNNVSGHYAVTDSRDFFHADRQLGAQENAAFGSQNGERASPVSSSRDHVPWSGNTPPSKESNERRRIRIG